MTDEWDHPVFKTREAFDDRVAELLSEEQSEPEAWWYLSFATADEFLGGAYVKAQGGMGAVLAARLHGCNPGGQVQMLGPITDDAMDANVPSDKRWRLLTETEVNE